MTTPVLFVSHGAPDLILGNGPTLDCWSTLGQQLPRPSAVLMISAHWLSHKPVFSTAAQPATIHDFGGFPPELYRVQYPAPGAPHLEAQVREALENAGFSLQIDTNRGLDHGAWVPLRYLYPQADMPVAQLSLQAHAGPEWSYRIGQSLRPLREAGVMIIASGAVTHNFGWLSASKTLKPEAQVFSDWLGKALQEHRLDDLLHYRERSPFGRESHPTEDHLLPLYVAFGASNATDKLTRFTPESTYGSLAMDAYLWA